jgi:hypothetical protein
MCLANFSTELFDAFAEDPDMFALKTIVDGGRSPHLVMSALGGELWLGGYLGGGCRGSEGV